MAARIDSPDLTIDENSVIVLQNAGPQGAPISWGVCEVPGWGYQMDRDRVLIEMREVGLSATEFGPLGFLPTEPEAMATVLAEHNLHAVGGFTPLVLHV